MKKYYERSKYQPFGKAYMSSNGWVKVYEYNPAKQTGLGSCLIDLIKITLFIVGTIGIFILAWALMAQ